MQLPKMSCLANEVYKFIRPVWLLYNSYLKMSSARTDH